jgi:multiple sugar transport system substrate-binding protein
MRNKIARRYSAVLVAATSVLAACSASSDPNILQFNNDKPPFAAGYKAMSDDLSRQTGLSLKLNTYPDPAAYATAIRTGGAAGVKPALFTWHTGGQLQELVAAQQVEPTTDIWKAATADGTLPASIEKYYTVDGQQYCVPHTLDYWGMYYNKDIFAKYKLKVPSTWDELMNIAATLKANGQTPFYQVTSTLSFVWFQTLLGQSDPNAYTQLVNGEIPFTAPPVVRAMELWKSLIDKGYMSDPTVQTNQQNLLASEDVAMVPSGTWLNSGFASINFPASRYGFFLIPNVTSLPKQVTFFESSPLCASPGTSTTPKARQAMQWWISTPAQEVWAKTEQNISVNPKVASPVADFTTLNNAVKNSELEILERYYEAVPAQVLQESLNDFSAFEVDTSSYLEQLGKIQKVNESARARRK